VISPKISNHKKRKYLRPYFTFNKRKNLNFLEERAPGWEIILPMTSEILEEID